MKETISIQHVIQQLKEIGVEAGDTLIVHASFSKIRPVEKGVSGMISALEKVLGTDGTLVMPSMSWEDEKIFDPQTTPCNVEMGILADTFWRQNGVLRASSAHAFAAKGKHAPYITAEQPLDIPHGMDSPVGRVHELDGKILLLGVGHHANTTIHLAEYTSGVRYRVPKKLRIRKDGEPVWFDYEEIDHCCQNFELADHWLAEREQITHGTVGHADARLMCSRDLVAVVTEKLTANETTFLHPYGVDEECDAARDSLKQFGV